MHENTILSTAAEDILMNVLNKPIELSADLVTINIGDISPLQSPTKTNKNMSKSRNEALVDDETTDDLTEDSNQVIKVDVTDLVNKNDFIIPDPNFFDKVRLIFLWIKDFKGFNNFNFYNPYNIP